MEGVKKAGVRNTGQLAALVHRFQSVIMILTGYPPFSILDSNYVDNEIKRLSIFYAKVHYF